MSKYHAKRTWSNLLNRWFDSKGECQHGEELHLRALAGEITDLQHQVRFILCKEPRVSITVDFAYKENGIQVHEDFKGLETREFRVKRIWLEKQEGIRINIVH